MSDRTPPDEPVSDPYKLPLPEEIAGLLTRVDAWRPTNPNEAITGNVQLYLDLADALRALAQENERLKAQPLPPTHCTS